MLNSIKHLVVIPARGGSKGIPKKNIKKLNGKPLINYTIEQARKLFLDSEIYVSTDCLKIKHIVEKSGLKIPFIRPSNLSTDTSTTTDVLLHSIEFYKNDKGFIPDVIILLQPTSPFRSSVQISEAFDLWVKNNDVDMVASVKKTTSNPYYVLFEENDQGFLSKTKKGKFNRRQDCPQVYELNGAIYIISVNSLLLKPINEFSKIKKYLMDEFTSHDIDTEYDWKMAELIEKMY